MLTMVLAPEFVEEKVISPDFSANEKISAFERFLRDGGVNSPDLYLCRENEDFSFEAVLSIDELIAESQENSFVRSA